MMLLLVGLLILENLNVLPVREAAFFFNGPATMSWGDKGQATQNK